MTLTQSAPHGPRFVGFFTITGDPLVVRPTAEEARQAAVEWGHLDDDSFVEVLDISACLIPTHDFIYRYSLPQCRHYPTVWRGDGYGNPVPAKEPSP
jgi:hypothetical protein